jgi:hypothetical protein
MRLCGSQRCHAKNQQIFIGRRLKGVQMRFTAAYGALTNGNVFGG